MRTIEDLKIEFLKNKNEEEAKKQEKYLRNQFKFIGLKKPIRSEIEKPFLNEWKEKEKKELIKMIGFLHNLEEREYIYTAQQLSLKIIKSLNFNDIIYLTELTLVNSWWENTDGYNMVIKRWLKSNPKYIKEYIEKYYNSENFWLKRISLICQLGINENMDFESLDKAIMYNLDDSEFFVQKAIGWILRDYGKYNPEKVIEYLHENKNKLSKLAYNEAGKKLL